MYCKQCGNFVSAQAEYCPKCGYNISNTENLNDSDLRTVLIDKTKKCKTASFIGIIIPLIINFMLIILVSIIFISGPLDGDLNNLNYINSYELTEFAVSYGLIYLSSLIVNVPTLIIMLIKTKQLSDFQMKLQTNYSNEIVNRFFDKFNTTPVIIITIFSAVFLGVLFAIPQIIICVMLNNFRKFYKTSNSHIK